MTEDGGRADPGSRPSALAFHTLHFSPLVGGDVPVLDVLTAAAAAGFSEVGLDVDSIEAHVAAGRDVREVADALHELGLSVTDLVHLSVSADEAETERNLRRVLAVCEPFTIPWCVVAVPGPVPTADLGRSLDRRAAILADHGMRLAVEFSAHAWLGTFAHAVEVCATVGWDRAGVVVDSLHFFRAGAEWEELAACAADQIALVQLADGPAAAPADLGHESHARRLLPGDGGLDLDAFVAAVQATGYAGPVVGEVLAEDLRAADPIEVATAVHRSLVRLWES